MDTAEFLKTNMLFNTRTGNPLWDMITSMIIMSVISGLVGFAASLKEFDFKGAYQRFMTYFEKSSITLSGDMTTNKYMERQFHFSFTLKAIIDKINTLEKYESGIRHLKEIHDTNLFNNFRRKIKYGVDQFPSFYLGNKIYCKIYYSQNSSKTKDEVSKSDTTSIRIYSYVYTLDVIEKYIDELVEEYRCKLDKEEEGKRYIFTYTGEDDCKEPHFTKKNFETTKSFDNIFFDEKESIVGSIQFFRDNKEWYFKKGVPYTQGYLLHGKPGCGKSSFICALAKELDYHILIVPFNRVKTCSSLQKIWDCEEFCYTKANITNTVICFEDFDCTSSSVMLKRDDNVTPIEKDQPIDSNIILASAIKDESKEMMRLLKESDDALNLSFVLNLFQGINDYPGRVLTITTNHVDKLDPALIRPGRIDINIEMKPCSRKSIKEMYEHFYEEELPHEYFDRLSDGKFTPAEVSNGFFLNKMSPKEGIELFCF